MPARYSPIAPLHLLEQLHDKQLLGNYLLLLAHDVLEHPRGYIDLVDSLEPILPTMEEEEKKPFIIMDNSVIERGEAMPVLKVIEAADLVNANCIVVPDVLGNFTKTQKLIIEQSSQLRNSGYPLMKIPQGQSIYDLVNCVDWMRNYLPVPEGDPDYWGVPRWVTNELGTRASVVYYISMRTPDPKIHLLGMSKNRDDDMFCTSMNNVMGIDSANPLVLGLKRALDMESGEYEHIERGEYWNTRSLNDQAEWNVDWAHGNVG